MIKTNIENNAVNCISKRLIQCACVCPFLNLIFKDTYMNKNDAFVWIHKNKKKFYINL